MPREGLVYFLLESYIALSPPSQNNDFPAWIPSLFMEGHEKLMRHKVANQINTFHDDQCSEVTVHPGSTLCQSVHFD